MPCVGRLQCPGDKERLSTAKPQALNPKTCRRLSAEQKKFPRPPPPPPNTCFRESVLVRQVTAACECRRSKGTTKRISPAVIAKWGLAWSVHGCQIRLTPKKFTKTRFARHRMMQRSNPYIAPHARHLLFWTRSCLHALENQP